MIKGIIFDLDGTLVRLPINYNKIFTKLQDLFDTKDEFRPLIPTIIKKANNNSKLIEKAFDIICEEEVIAANNFKTINGSIDTINYFKNNNYLLCLVTMQCMKAAKIILDKLEISEFFSSIITRDISSERSIQIKNSVNFLSFSPTEVIMVGDRIHDVVSAKQVGCTPILFNKSKMDSFNDCKVISELPQLMKLSFFT